MGIKKFIKQSKTSIITINDEITHLAMEYVENYALSDSMELADAVVNDETLCTANGKHYKCIPELQMSVFKVE